MSKTQVTSGSVGRWTLGEGSGKGRILIDIAERNTDVASTSFKNIFGCAYRERHAP